MIELSPIELLQTLAGLVGLEIAYRQRQVVICTSLAECPGRRCRCQSTKRLRCECHRLALAITDTWTAVS